MRSEITIIIFSKNRACQLELLLRGFSLPAMVLYTCDEKFSAGYEKLKGIYPNIRFVLETDFRKQVMENLGEYTLFFCDDDVVIEPFDDIERTPEFERFKKDEQILCLSLRMSPSYAHAPVLENNTWKWREARATRNHPDWVYPMSVTSHIFRKKDLLKSIGDFDFTMPNQLERVLRKHPIDRPLMMCFDRPKIINNLANQVQTWNLCSNAGVTIEELEQKFLGGERLSAEHIKKEAVFADRPFLKISYEYEHSQNSSFPNSSSERSSEITTIIFSKNRACQLDLLLRNLAMPSSVIYTYDPEFKAGYDKLIKMYPKVNFILQTNLKEQVLEMLKSAKDYIMFFGDDDIILEHFDERCPEFAEFKKNPDILCLSLRLCNHYGRGRPEMSKNNTWEWQGKKHSWGYPMATTSTIFRKEDILPVMLKIGDLNLMHHMERWLRKFPPARPLMMCFDEPKVINNEANNVQTAFPTPNFGVEPKLLEERFLNGERLSWEHIRNIAKTSSDCFIRTDFEWEKAEPENDLTIIYYTANKISDYFYQNAKEQLLKSAGNIPIISVSQKPIDLGQNICVGDIGQSYINIYRQALIGAKAAKTRYIVMAEDDILYSPEHFAHRPAPGIFEYNLSVQAIYSWSNPPIFSYKGRRVLSNLICERDLFITAMEERFAKYPDEKSIPLGSWSEPGKYEKALGVTVRKSEGFMTEIPNVVFSHPDAIGYAYLGERKARGTNPTEEIPYWGKAKDIINNFYKNNNEQKKPMNAFEHIVAKFNVDLTKPSPTFLTIGREGGFLELLKELGVKKGVEIGVYKGKYAEVIMRNVPDLDLTAIDAWKFYDGYNDYPQDDLEINAYNQAVARGEKHHFKILKAWSLDAAKEFADESLDFLYLDGNHDYVHVIEDLNAWSPKIKRGGIIAGHDFFESRQDRYAVAYAVPAWCSYRKVPMLFVMGGDKVPSWFYVKP